MILEPGKLAYLDGSRMFFKDLECDQYNSPKFIDDQELVLLLNGEFALGDSRLYNAIKILTVNGVVGYIFYKVGRKMFKEI